MAEFDKPLDVLEYPRLSLYTPAPGVDKERASIGWSTLNNMPRCTVWTRSDDKERGPIFGSYGQEALQGFVHEVMKILASNTADSVAFDYLRNPEQGSYDKVLNSTLIAGRGEDGMCYIGLKSADEARPKIIFTFRGYEWHPMRLKSRPYTQEEMSTIHCRAYFKLLETSLLSTVKGQTIEERKALAERRQARRGGSGGGGGGNSYQQKPKPAQTFTDTGFGDDFTL